MLHLFYSPLNVTGNECHKQTNQSIKLNVSRREETDICRSHMLTYRFLVGPQVAEQNDPRRQRKPDLNRQIFTHCKVKYVGINLQVGFKILFNNLSPWQRFISRRQIKRHRDSNMRGVEFIHWQTWCH